MTLRILKTFNWRQIPLRKYWGPLPGFCGHAEQEQAFGIVLAALQHQQHVDVREGIPFDAVIDFATSVGGTNPFFRPDFLGAERSGLLNVVRGDIVRVGVTEAGLLALYWWTECEKAKAAQ